MKTKIPIIDTFQIVGFVISTVIAIILIFFNIDPTLSVLLGLVLAVLTQLFDLQLRQMNAEERLLQANVLSQFLYRDERLLSQLQQIVNDYYAIKNGWFALFKLRADDSINECSNVLHKLVEGEMEVPPRSPFTFAFEGIKSAKRSIKGVTTDNIAYWRSIESEKYLQANSDAVGRGVHFVRVFVESKNKVAEIEGVLSKHKNLGIDVYLAFSEELPKDLNKPFLIMDDRVVTRLERIGNQRARETNISTNPMDVERSVKEFDMIMRYARKYDDSVSQST